MMQTGLITFAPCTGCLCAGECAPHRACLKQRMPLPGIERHHASAAALPMGWQCPLCRRVHAPSVSGCACAVYNGPG